MTFLPIAVRAYTERAKPRGRHHRTRSPEAWPREVLLFDTETATDTTQRLNFGSYRYCAWSGDGLLVCREEGLFYADDLAERDPEGFACLQDFARNHEADVGPGVHPRLRLRSRKEFVDAVLWNAYQAEALVVAFNLPFDLSRLAVGWGRARRDFRGGFSLVLWDRPDRRGSPNPFRPRLAIQHIDSKKAFLRFTRPARTEGSDGRFHHAGRFLDLRTLAHALTGRGHTLESAGKAFRVDHPKAEATVHGAITPEYIDYNRRDVLSSQELLERMREEFDRHPIDLPPDQAYSPASIAKAYFRAMGLRSPIEQFRGIPSELLGHSMSAFYGGRAECRLRKVPVPVVHTDFTSMYPTVQSLMGLWDLLSASRIEVEDATPHVRALLERVSVEGCFRPEVWREFRGFAEVLPVGDVLPSRAQYQPSEWTVGVNWLRSPVPLWYAIPDLVASTLLAGKPPKVLRAFRLVPRGRQRGLKPIRLRGEVPVDPRENVFERVIESRQRVKASASLSEEEQERIQQLFKTFANAGSYGVFVEMNRKPTRADRPAEVSVYGRERCFPCKTIAPEDPGAFCFPPVASLITAAARLMLALLERSVTDAGGSYAFADTDSMAIVASKAGGRIACPGGLHRTSAGDPAIRALSWDEVDAIVARFEALNPYDRAAVPGSILKIEKVNFDPETKRRRQLFAYAISAKRYALFTIDPDGRSQVVPQEDGYSEHGLGQLMNPTDPDADDHVWTRQVWEGIVGEALGGPAFQPAWLNVPAMMKSAITTPLLLDRFSGLDRGKDYPASVKPFNFLLSATVSAIERPPLARSAGGFHLIAPYSRNPSDWLRSWWIDLHSRERYRIQSEGRSSPAAIRVQTFADVLERFRAHPEAKSAAPDGERSDARTVGLLDRLDVEVLTVFHIGKETNLFEEQEEGMLLADPLQLYRGGGEWELVRPWLDQISISELSARSGVSPRVLRNYRKGDRTPSPGKETTIMERLTVLVSRDHCSRRRNHRPSRKANVESG